MARSTHGAERLHRVAVALAGEAAQPIEQRGRTALEVHERKPTPRFDAHRVQRELVTLKCVVAEVACGPQRAIESV